MYVTPTAFARWSRARSSDADRYLQAGLPWMVKAPTVHAINVPPDPPEPRLPDDWPKPPPLPEEPQIDPNKPPKHDPPPEPEPQIEPEIPGKEPPMEEPPAAPPRIDARC